MVKQWGEYVQKGANWMKMNAKTLTRAVSGKSYDSTQLVESTIESIDQTLNMHYRRLEEVVTKINSIKETGQRELRNEHVEAATLHALLTDLKRQECSVIFEDIYKLEKNKAALKSAIKSVDTLKSVNVSNSLPQELSQVSGGAEMIRAEMIRAIRDGTNVCDKHFTFTAAEKDQFEVLTQKTKEDQAAKRRG